MATSRRQWGRIWRRTEPFVKLRLTVNDNRAPIQLSTDYYSMLQTWVVHSWWLSVFFALSHDSDNKKKPWVMGDGKKKKNGGGMASGRCYWTAFFGRETLLLLHNVSRPFRRSDRSGNNIAFRPQIYIYINNNNIQI